MLPLLHVAAAAALADAHHIQRRIDVLHIALRVREDLLRNQFCLSLGIFALLFDVHLGLRVHHLLKANGHQAVVLF